jgi:hypothetical protein
VGRDDHAVIDPLRAIDVQAPRDVDRLTPPARLTPVEREEARERREQARKRRRKPPYQAPEAPSAGDGHIDLRA